MWFGRVKGYLKLKYKLSNEKKERRASYSSKSCDTLINSTWVETHRPTDWFILFFFSFFMYKKEIFYVWEVLNCQVRDIGPLALKSRCAHFALLHDLKLSVCMIDSTLFCCLYGRHVRCEFFLFDENKFIILQQFSEQQHKKHDEARCIRSPYFFQAFKQFRGNFIIFMDL